MVILLLVLISKTDRNLFREISEQISSVMYGSINSRCTGRDYLRSVPSVRNANMRSGAQADRDTVSTTITASRESASKTFSFNNYSLSVLLMVRNLSFGEALCTRKSQL